MSTGQGGGDFNITDDTSGAPTEMTSLLGINQAVGQTPVLIRAGHPMRRFGEPDVKSTSEERLTIEQTLLRFYQTDPNELTALQDQLLAGGFYADKYYSKNPKQVDRGAHDDDTYAAFRKAVVQAARSGQALPEVIDAAGQARSAQVSGTTPVQFTNPDDLRASFDAAGPNVIGRRPDPSVVDNAIAVYHELESQAANQSDPAGNVVAPPSTAAFVEQYLRRTYPADAYRNGYADAYSAFSNLLGGGK